MVYITRELRNSFIKFRNMMRISSATPQDKLDPVFREVDQDRIQTNFIKMIPASIILLFIETCGIIYNLMSGSTVKYRIVYFIAFAIYLINTLIVLRYIDHMLENDVSSKRKKEAICYIYWMVYSFSAMTFSVFEILDTGTTNHFFIFVFAISICPIFEPLYSIAYYILPLGFQLYFVHYTNAKYPVYIFCIFICIVGAFSSYIKYSAYMTRKISSKRLERIAEIDPLTGLLNRRGMKRSVEGIWEYCKAHQIPITIALLDIDFFKMYNDRYGHANGDQCLKRISTCIKSCFARRTDITCRYGGEEFVIILAGESETQSTLSFVNLQNKIEQLKIKSGNLVFNEYVTVSIGVCSSLISDNTTIDELLKVADSELYNAKEKGRKCLSIHGELYNNKKNDR